MVFSFSKLIQCNTHPARKLRENTHRKSLNALQELQQNVYMETDITNHKYQNVRLHCFISN